MSTPLIPHTSIRLISQLISQDLALGYFTEGSTLQTVLSRIASRLPPMMTVSNKDIILTTLDVLETQAGRLEVRRIWKTRLERRKLASSPPQPNLRFRFRHYQLQKGEKIRASIRKELMELAASLSFPNMQVKVQDAAELNSGLFANIVMKGGTLFLEVRSDWRERVPEAFRIVRQDGDAAGLNLDMVPSQGVYTQYPYMVFDAQVVVHTWDGLSSPRWYLLIHSASRTGRWFPNLVAMTTFLNPKGVEIFHRRTPKASLFAKGIPVENTTTVSIAKASWVSAHPSTWLYNSKKN